MKFHFALIFFSVLLTGCATEVEPVEKLKKSPVQVTVQPVEAGLAYSFQTTGEVQASQATLLTAENRAVVREIFGKIGQVVEQNFLLLKLSSENLLAEERAALVALQNAEASLARTKTVNQKNIAGALAGLQTAEVKLAEIQAQNAALIKQAQESLTMSKVSAELAVAAAETNLESIVNSMAPVVRTALNASDEILGISETYADQNDSFEELLGNSAREKKWFAEDKLKVALTEIAKGFPASDAQTEALALLELTEQTVQAVLAVLYVTPTGNNLAQDQLNLMIQKIVNELAKVRATKASLLAAITGLRSANQLNPEGEAQNIKAAEANFAAVQAQAQAAERTALQAVKTAQTTLALTEKSAELSALNAKTVLDNAKSRLDQAQINSAKLKILAPFAGQVRQVFVERGEEVNPGTPLVNLEGRQGSKIVADVPVEVVRQLILGHQVKVGGDFLAKITAIAPSANSATQKFQIEVGLQGSNLKIGEVVSLELPLAGEVFAKKIFIPITAVQLFAAGNFVWTVEEGKAVKTFVELGQVVGGSVEVLKGLELGEALIVGGGRILVEDDEGREVIVVDD